MTEIPRYAMFRRKRVRVLEYVGSNTFRVLANNDATYRVPKHLLTFLPDANANAKQSA